ncbi:MAG: hypothetical protein Q8L82_04985 [Nitrosomonas sp.]|nr:hypothetical protein [Nitrosomonas sp.]
MNKKQKLELTWIGKEKRPKLEPRILLEEPERSYHAKHRVTENDIFDNRLIFGDGDCQASCRLNVFIHAATLCSKPPFICSSLMC